MKEILTFAPRSVSSFSTFSISRQSLVSTGINFPKLTSSKAIVSHPSWRKQEHLASQKSHFTTTLSSSTRQQEEESLGRFGESPIRRLTTINTRQYSNKSQKEEVPHTELSGVIADSSMTEAEPSFPVEKSLIVTNKIAELQVLRNRLKEVCFKPYDTTIEEDLQSIVVRMISMDNVHYGKEKNPALIYALEAGNTKLIEYLRQKKIGFEGRDEEGNTVMHKAAQFHRLDIIKEMSEEDMYTTKDFSGEVAIRNKIPTPLHTAVYFSSEEGDKGSANQSAEIIKELISLEIDLNQKAKIREENLPEVTPTQLAVIKGKTEALKVLIENKVDLNQKFEFEGSNNTLLHAAVWFRRLEVLKILLKEAAFSKSTIQSAFIYAAENGITEVLDIFAGVFRTTPGKGKGGINEKDENGNIALHEAIKAGKLEAVRILVKKEGASTTERNGKGERPIELAQTYWESASDKDESNRKGILAILENAERNKRNHKDKASPKFNKFNPIRNLVFKGGGPKGFAYIGALKRLTAETYNVERVAGTSAGAITATLFALGCDHNDLRKISEETTLDKFIDHPSHQELENFKNDPSFFNGLKTFINLCKGYFSEDKAKQESTPTAIFRVLREQHGLCTGKFFKNWIEEQIEQRTRDSGIGHSRGFTFGQLKQAIKAGKPYKHLYIIAIDLGSETRPQSIIIFNSEDDRFQNVSIADAVRASMSIPGVFQPHIIKDGEKELYRCVDGGLLFNYPLKIFDKAKFVYPEIEEGNEKGEYPIGNKSTVGLFLKPIEQSITLSDLEKDKERVEIEEAAPKTQSSILLYKREERKPLSFNDFVIRVGKVYKNAEVLSNEYWKGYDKPRTIEISDCGVSILDFQLTQAKKEELIKSGEEGAEEFIKRQEGGSNQSINEKPKDKNPSKQETIPPKEDPLPKKGKQNTYIGKLLTGAFTATALAACWRYVSPGEEWTTAINVPSKILESLSLNQTKKVSLVK